MVTVKHDPCRTAHMRPLVVKQRSSSAHASLRSARGYKRKPRPNIPDKRKPRARMPHPTNREEIVLHCLSASSTKTVYDMPADAL